MKHTALSMGILVSVVGSALAQDATLSIELVEINGFDVPGAPASSGSVASGDFLTVEMFIRDWSPTGQELRGYQLQIDSAGYTSGTAGNIFPRDWATTTDINPCTLADGDPNSDNAYIDVDHCTGEPPVRQDPSGSDVGVWGVGNPCFIDDCFAGDGSCNVDQITFDWLHGGIDLDIVNTYMDSTRCDYRYGEALNQGVSGPSTGVKLYAGTVLLEVSGDAAGTFTLCLDPASTILVDETGADIPVAGHVCLTIGLSGCGCLENTDCKDPDPCVRAICADTCTCANHPRFYGDVNHDGAKNIVDLICMARMAFQNATHCSGFPINLSEIDYAPNDAGCGDGVLNIIDVIITARIAFQNLDDICCGFTSDQSCAEVTGGAPHCP